MIFLKFYFSLITLIISCKYSEQNFIVVIGKADNRKEGAVVICKDDKKAYFLDGMDSWNENIYGKMVKVSGKLLIEEIKEIPQKSGMPIPQQMIGTKRTILKSKWKLVK